MNFYLEIIYWNVKLFLYRLNIDDVIFHNKIVFKTQYTILIFLFSLFFILIFLIFLVRALPQTWPLSKDRHLGTIAALIWSYQNILSKKVTIKFKKSESRSGKSVIKLFQ